MRGTYTVCYLLLHDGGLILNKFRIYNRWNIRRRNSCQLPVWMKNSPYHSATAGIRPSDLLHSMTMSEKVPRSHLRGHWGICYVPIYYPTTERPPPNNDTKRGHVIDPLYRNTWMCKYVPYNTYQYLSMSHWNWKLHDAAYHVLICVICQCHIMSYHEIESFMAQLIMS